MFIGHIALALGAKKAAPRTSLGTLVAATMFLDLLWPLLLLAGVEQVRIDKAATVFTPLDFIHYPWSHSLEMSMVWAAVCAGLYMIARRYARGAAVVGLLVVSHWLLDFITHRPDLPILLFGDTKVGLGLWNNVPVVIGLELGLFAFGLLLYTNVTRARDRIGGAGLATAIILLLVSYFGAAFGPLPPDSQTIAISALALYLFIPLFAWIDRHRGQRQIN